MGEGEHPPQRSCPLSSAAPVLAAPRSFFFKKLMPVGLFSAMTLWSGNVVYMHLTVSFIQVGRLFFFFVSHPCLPPHAPSALFPV